VAGNTYGHLLGPELFGLLLFFHFNLDFIRRVEAQERAVASRDYPWLSQYIYKTLNPSTAYMKRQRSATEIEGRRQAARAKRRQLAAFRAGAVPAPLQGYVRTSSAYRRGAGVGETKFFDTGNSDSGDATAGSINLLCTVPQDATESGRVGRKINVKSINIRAYFTLDSQSTNPPTGAIVRWMIIMDKQTNGATFAMSDLLAAVVPNGFRNLDNVDRFVVIKDKSVTLNCMTMNSTTSSAINYSRQIRFTKKCNIPIEYSGTTGVIGQVKSNNLYFVYISSDVVSNAIWKGRIRYTDF